jgi:hypothetical protein
MRIGVAIALGVAALVTGAAGGAGVEPGQLRGAPLGTDTGLRLLVADDPPLLLDVDSRRTTRVAGIPEQGGVHRVVSVGGRAGVFVGNELYGVRGRAARVVRLGRGTDAIAAADGRSVWVQGRTGTRCSLAQLALDGRRLRAPRPFPCSARSDPSAGPLGLVVHRMRVVDPHTARTALRTDRGIVAVAGRSLVLSGPGRGFTLLDARTGVRKRLAWPSMLGWGGGGVADPRGRYVALEFANPAWRGGPEQAEDVWLLDTRTGELSQLPGMPALVHLKRTSLSWTDDGRLVLLGEDDAGGFVAVWRPGEPQLAVARLRIPERDGASDSFAVLR